MTKVSISILISVGQHCCYSEIRNIYENFLEPYLTKNDEKSTVRNSIIKRLNTCKTNLTKIVLYQTLISKHCTEGKH